MIHHPLLSCMTIYKHPLGEAKAKALLKSILFEDYKLINDFTWAATGRRLTEIGCNPFSSEDFFRDVCERVLEEGFDSDEDTEKLGEFFFEAITDKDLKMEDYL